MPIIRKKLTTADVPDSGCCDDPFGTPVITRVTADGTIQVSKDDGMTWVNDATDPRVTQPSLAPISGSGDLSCQAASNIVAAFKPIQHSISVLLTGTVALLALSGAIAAIIAEIIFNPSESYRLVPVIIKFATDLVSETSTDYDAAFTDTQWHLLLCAIQCTIGTDGVFNVSEFAACIAKIGTDVTDPVCLNTFNLIFTGTGVLGINNMGSQHATEEDCSDCGCEACDLTTWGILTNGSIVGTASPSLVTINGVLSGGGYRIDFTSHFASFDPSVAYTTNCCILYFRTLSDGGGTSDINKVDCGGSYSGNLNHPAGSPTANPVWLIEYDSTTPIQVQISTNGSFT